MSNCQVWTKKLLLILCLWLVECTNEQYADYSQSSGFDRTQIDSTTLENLEVLGRVWGYVKYHHPVFADDKYNIDYELFELLPRIADADRTIRNRVLTQWIDELGEFTINRERYDTLPPDLIGRQTIDLSWAQSFPTVLYSFGMPTAAETTTQQRPVTTAIIPENTFRKEPCLKLLNHTNLRRQASKMRKLTKSWLSLTTATVCLPHSVFGI